MPRPMFEILVYSPRTEGVHLRAGAVARGGIRWSDRREDFRTEILGLMKAQTVKNAVIVPTGAKGGFVVKRPPTDREALREEVVECYRTLIRGLLDVTDTMVDGAVVAAARRRPLRRRRPVPRRRGRQGHGHVLRRRQRALGRVRLLARRRLRLRRLDRLRPQGDGDHRARRVGVREAPLPRARRRTSRPPTSRSSASATCPATSSATGCSSRATSSWSAPSTTATSSSTRTPIAGASYDERARLFALPASSWADYDARLISKGGGVFPRAAKSIQLSDEARAALAVEARSLTPNELIRALLRAPVDLLWNGGIGTFVKAAAGDARRRRRPRERRDPRRRAGASLPRRRRGRQPRADPASPCRIRLARRPRGHGCDRQLRRRRLLGPRGQHQDPGRHDRRRGRPDREATQHPSRGDVRRGR